MLSHPKMRAVAGLSQSNLVYVGGNKGTSSGSNPSIALNALTGGIASTAASGDLVIGVIGNRTVTTSDFYSVGVWDNSIASASDTTGLRLHYMALRKRLTAADTSIQFNAPFTADHAFMVQVWRNSNAATQMDATATTWAGTGVPDAPSITTVTAGAVVVVVGVASGYATDLTVPSDCAYFLHQPQGLLRLALAARTTNAAGAVDPAVFGGGDASAKSGAVSIAIRPA